MRDVKARLEQILEMAERLEARKSDLQEAGALDAGFPVAVTGLEVDLAVGHLRTMEEEIPWVANGRPYGGVAAIFPYDAPTVVLARLGGGALLTGNRLRFSFSSQTPRTAALIREICSSIDGLEPVVGMDNREFGSKCVEDDGIRVLFISGGSAVGETYLGRRDAFDKLFFAGPGGMPAAVVFQDADMEKASRFIARRAFINGGQYCTTLKKALIHRSGYERVREQVLEMAARLCVGNPFDSSTDIGPIQVRRTRLILEDALRKCAGTRLLRGGIDAETVSPIVLEAESDWRIPDLELFGPFLLLKPFDDPKRAVQEVIRTRYGFLLAFFGSTFPDALSLFDENFGMVHDNPEFFFTPLRHPFGGKKESGWIVERRGSLWTTRDGGFLYSKELVFIE
jgi:acyl-CoA reductase-like NAD-dependent aldehyde dehydrogenase